MGIVLTECGEVFLQLFLCMTPVFMYEVWMLSAQNLCNHALDLNLKPNFKSP